jgi:hypothetical protein
VLVKAPPTGNADPARDLDFFIINFKLNAHDLDGTDSESEPDSEESALASCLHREGVLPRNCSLRLSSVASGIILAYEVQRGDVADSQASTAPGMSSFALQHGDLVVMHWTRLAPLKDASSSARATAVTPRSRSVEALVGRGGLQARFLLAVLYAAPGPAGSVSVSREFTNALSTRAALSLYYEVCRRVRVLVLTTAYACACGCGRGNAYACAAVPVPVPVPVRLCLCLCLCRGSWTSFGGRTTLRLTLIDYRRNLRLFCGMTSFASARRPASLPLRSQKSQTQTAAASRKLQPLSCIRACAVVIQRLLKVLLSLLFLG